MSNEAKLDELAARVARLESDNAEARARLRASNRRWSAGVATLLVAGLAFWSAPVVSQQLCATGLACFSAGSPALASDVNANFKQLKDWLEQKVGTAGTTAVTITGTTQISADATVTGTTTHTGATFHNGATTHNSTTTFNDSVTMNGSSNPRKGLRVNGPLYSDFPDSTYDVWIQGGSDTSGANRNLALLGVDNDSGDYLVMNYGGEYTGGAQVQSSLNVTGPLQQEGQTVVRRVTACCGGSSANCCPSGYSRVNVDLNQGAGGDYCYLCVDWADN